MKLTPRLQSAIDKAAIAHRGQRRKDGVTPMIVHPFGVAIILSNYTDDENVIIAGLLHDVIEDVDPKVYSSADIERDFGKPVLKLVQGVTEDKSMSSWKIRKQAYLDHLKAASAEVLLISAADMLHNLRSSVDSYKLMGEEFMRRFNGKGKDRNWFYKTRLQILSERLKSKILEELKTALAEFLKVSLDK